VLRAHVVASPKKSAMLGLLTVVLLVLLGRQLLGGPQSADAAPMVQAASLLPVVEPVEATSLGTPAILPRPPLPDRPARNPFAVDLALFAEAPGAIGEPVREPQQQAAVDPIEAAVARMRLQSTVTGPEAMAAVDGVFLRVGDRISGLTVERIGARMVVLRGQDRRFVLTMD